MQEYDNKNTKKELLEKCKELGITKYSSKNKTELINLINKTINDKYCKLNMIDLFAGTGAFSLAFKKKVNIVFANDMMTYSKKIYDENFDQSYYDSAKEYGDASFEKSRKGDWTNFYRDAINHKGESVGEHELKVIKLKVNDYREK
jgi:adenine-specific DNA methylase